jgi:hypothetical protein
MKLIKVNPNNKQYYSKEFIRGFNLGAERQYEADIADIPTWIPCSERLPEYGVPVLTWDGSMWTVEQRIPFIIDDDFNRIYSEWWVDADFDEDYEDAGYYPNLRDGAAVAWMPLPSAYQGE